MTKSRKTGKEQVVNALLANLKLAVTADDVEAQLERQRQEWDASNAKLIESFKKTDKEILILLLKDSLFWNDRYNKSWDETFELLQDYKKLYLQATADLPVMGAELIAKTAALKRREAALHFGRMKGAKSQSERAAEVWAHVEQINADLLKKPESARWALKERAAYIEKWLNQNGMWQANGKPYSFGTIYKRITGKG